MSISLGKLRGLQNTSTDEGMFVVVALDHRGGLRRAINPDNPQDVSVADMAELKGDIAKILTKYSSAILLDPETGLGNFIAEGIIPGDRGLILTLDATGYRGSSENRVSRILSGWSVEKIKKIGASGLKLLVYFHPDANTALQQKDLIERVAEKCYKSDLAFFLEPLSFPLDPDQKKLPSDEKQEVVVETVKQLGNLGADVLKLEFPVDVSEVKDETKWMAACEQLNEASPLPWLLLSAGVDFDTYVRQVIVASKAGASGVMVGRALWKEAISLIGDNRVQFLQNVGIQRLNTLAEKCQTYGQSYKEYFDIPEVNFTWYRDY